MALNFPNQSRSFDEARFSVRFSGYDGMQQVRFLIEAKALAKSNRAANATTNSEAACLAAFDAARASIQDVARLVYSHSRQPIYILTEKDFS